MRAKIPAVREFKGNKKENKVMRKGFMNRILSKACAVIVISAALLLSNAAFAAISYGTSTGATKHNATKSMVPGKIKQL